MAQAGNFQCQGSVSGTALGRFGAAGSWLPSSPEAAGEVPPEDSALPVTAMRQGAGPRVARGVRREGGCCGPAWPALRPDGDPGQAGAGPRGGGPTPSLTLRGSSRVGVPRAAPRAAPSRAGGAATRAERRRGTARGPVGGQCGRRRPALREWGRAARAWPSVYVCACQSTLTACSPLAGPRRPAPPSVAAHWPV